MRIKPKEKEMKKAKRVTERVNTMKAKREPITATPVATAEVAPAEDYALKNVTEGLCHIEDRVSNIDNRLSNLIMRLTGEPGANDDCAVATDEGFLPATNSSIGRISDIIEAAVTKLERIEFLTG